MCGVPTEPSIPNDAGPVRVGPRAWLVLGKAAAAAAAVVVVVGAVSLILPGSPAQTGPAPAGYASPAPGPSPSDASATPEVTPSPGTTSGSSGPSGSPTKPVPGPATGYAVSAYGDSVMLGAVSQMRAVMPNISINADISLRLSHMASSIRTAKANGSLAPIVVIHAGTNGDLTVSAYDALLTDLADRRLVVLITIKISRPIDATRMANNNGVIWTAASHHANVVVADWYSLSLPHDEWFNDSWLAHLGTSGRIAYANLIASKVRDAPPAPAPDPTQTPSALVVG
jgi:hypothetical protein